MDVFVVDAGRVRLKHDTHRLDNAGTTQLIQDHRGCECARRLLGVRLDATYEGGARILKLGQERIEIVDEALSHRGEGRRLAQIDTRREICVN